MTDNFYTIEAIPTTYQGIQFKSKLEAQTALFFDLCEIAWDYEINTFNLGYCSELPQYQPVTYYTPDFYLHGLQRWIETKGPEVYSEAYIKAALLAKHTSQLVQIWQGQVGHQEIWNLMMVKGRLRQWRETRLDRQFVQKSNIDNQRLQVILQQVTGWRFEK